MILMHEIACYHGPLFLPVAVDLHAGADPLAVESQQNVVEWRLVAAPSIWPFFTSRERARPPPHPRRRGLTLSWAWSGTHGLSGPASRISCTHHRVPAWWWALFATTSAHVPAPMPAPTSATVRHAASTSTTSFLSIMLPLPFVPLFLSQVQLAVMVHRRRWWLEGILLRVEPTRQIQDGECRHVEQHRDRDHDLLEMLGNTTDYLFHYMRLFDLVVEGGESRCHAVKMQCVVFNRLPLLEHRRFELTPQVLSRRFPYAVITDPHGGDSLQGLLGCLLVCNYWPHFLRHGAAERIKCLHVFLRFDAPFLNGGSEQSGFELDLHEQRLVGVVGLGEHWDPGFVAHLTNHPLNHVVLSFCHSAYRLDVLNSNGCTLSWSIPASPTKLWYQMLETRVRRRLRRRRRDHPRVTRKHSTRNEENSLCCFLKSYSLINHKPHDRLNMSLHIKEYSRIFYTI